MRAIKPVTIGNILALLFLFMACSEKKEDTDITETEGYRIYVDSLYKNYEKDIEVSNRQLIINLFDSISYPSLDLILRERAYPKNQDSRPRLVGYSLNEMVGRLQDKNPNIDSVKKYVHRFKTLRGKLLEDARSQITFKAMTDTLLDAKLFRDSILKSTDSIYIKHVDTLKSRVSNFQDAFEDLIPQKQWRDRNEIALKKEYRIKLYEERKGNVDFFSKLKEKSTILFCILIGSLLTNLVLALLLFKKKKNDENDIHNTYVTTPSDIHEEPERPAPVPLLTKERVSHIVKEEFDRFKKSLEKKFHKECVMTQETKLRALESDVLEDCHDQDFKDDHTLKTCIQQFIDAKRTALEEDIEKYVSKSAARKEIEAAINTEKFIARHPSHLISDDEIRFKVNQYKQNTYDILPKVRSKSELHEDILRLENEINAFVERRIKENSQLYFPFTDTHGIVLDDKKSKERERDSALKLTLHPKDTSKASFQLLYDYTEMMLGGIQSYDVLLMPICNLKGENFNRNGTRIQQLAEDGEMVLEEGKWRVTKKLDIKII